jgi:hypothetical protein
MSERPKLLEQMKQMADELRVKAHLAGMEAKDAWEKLEPRLHEYEKKASDAVDDVADELTEAGRELKGDFQKLFDQVKEKTQGKAGQ